MKINSYRFSSLLLLLILSVGIFSFTTVRAQDTPQDNEEPVAQALEISPPARSLSVDPGETVTIQISLRNISGGDLVVKGEVNDFVASGEDGSPKILLEGTEDNPYSMKGWVRQLPELLLVPREVKSFPVTISVPRNASPGGHFGVVRFSAVAPELEDTGVSLSTSLGTLLLITVSGDTVEDLSVAEFSVNHNGEAGPLFESAPLQFVERLENTGNTHVQPTGQVSITDMFGRKVAALNVNLAKSNVLPASTRQFEQPLDGSVIGDKWLFGRYEANLNLTYGADEQTISDTLSFWVIPYRLIGIIVVLLVIGFFAFRSSIRRYNRHIIERSR